VGRLVGCRQGRLRSRTRRSRSTPLWRALRRARFANPETARALVLPTHSVARQEASSTASSAADQPAPALCPRLGRPGRARSRTDPGSRGSARGGSEAEGPEPRASR
jgi:hypothetical protein